MKDPIGKKKKDGTYPKRDKVSSEYWGRIKRGFTDPVVSKEEAYQAMNLPPESSMDSGLAQQFNSHGEKDKDENKGIVSTIANFLDPYVFSASSDDVTRKVTDYVGTTSNQDVYFPNVNSKHLKELNKSVGTTSSFVKTGKYPNQEVITDPKVRTGSPLFPYRQMSSLEMEKKNKTAPESVFNKYLHRAAAHRSAQRRGEERPSDYYAPGYRKGGILYKK